MSRPAALTVEPSSARTWTHPEPAAHAARTPRLAGIPVRAELSCVVGGVLAAWTFASDILPETNPGHSTLAYWTAGAAGALLLLLSIVLHEVGHAVAAHRAGVGVARITLSVVGGTSELGANLRRARDEILVAAAGPLASLVTMAVAMVAHVLIVEMAGPGLPATLAALVAIANLAVVILNTVPGLPLDGGRVLRATVWAITGRREAATRFAAALGLRLGEVLIAVAVFASAFGFFAIALWTALLGLALRGNPA